MPPKMKLTDRRAQVLDAATAVVRDQLGFKDIDTCNVAGERCAIARAYGKPLVLIFVPEEEGPIRPETREFAEELGASVEDGPVAYVWATSTGERDQGYIYSWLPDKECEVSSLPLSSAIRAEQGVDDRPATHADPLGFKKLQAEFDELHERIYAARDAVSGSNDLTAQLCKCIFLKMHLERHPDFRAEPDAPPFETVFDAAYITANKKKAVQQIRDAFKVARALPDYNFVDDFGRSFQIFDQDDYIKFEKPETYAQIAKTLNVHRLTAPEETGIEDDILGRAFDVMLRAKFESKGGMGVYLTPQQVRDAMVQMAFHDLLAEDPGLLTRKDPSSGEPVFRVCDPCCGSAGFLVTAMRVVRKHVSKLLGLSDAQRGELLSEVFSHGFEGADNSPDMVPLARINMALHGDPSARVFRVSNSLTADHFKPESFDLILTNPPFKKGGIKAADQPEVMEFFQSDIAIDPADGLSKPHWRGDKLALGAKPDSKGNWKPVGSIDPAVLFIDRCLQLLKPGGRLLIVVPDGILSGSSDKYVREYLMGEKLTGGQFHGGKAIVRAVVSLPPVTFRLSGAGAKTSFLYLQKKRPGDEQGAVFMAVADAVGFDVKQNKEVHQDANDLVRIVEAYKAGRAKEDAE